MQTKPKLLIILFFLFTTSPAFAHWDSQCVSDCLSTGHECSYCDYQCYREPTTPYERIETNLSRCPFPGFEEYQYGQRAD